MRATKALRATTIIPDTLYVDREADRQLEGVIDEMGRPAYILVARQMGKTNLLLRMKRQREANGDLALYMDLSTHFDTAKDLFRAIVDKLVEALGEPECAKKIASDRAAGDIDANAEFDRHLRLLLADADQERVIIILDEIDSLVGHAYSDRILSQIRSMYFARANYPIYDKLTYVLSGVAEPTDLIKDRNVSPFNIGEKIYLNDFTLAEVSLLLTKAGLKFRPEIIEAVYHWASGNPRMTWDICSALEDVQRSDEALTVSSVDAVIQKLYLTRFDRAPLDHIRALAEIDGEVRDALIALLYGKGEALDDRARSKLYLAGITTASANEAPTIKNRVIEFALSEAWLSQVEAGKKGLLEAASKRHHEKNHLEAINLFEQYIESEGSDASLTEFHLVDLGMSYFTVARLADAERAYQSALDRTRSSTLRHLIRFHLGNTKMASGRASDAVPLFEEVSRHEGTYQLRAAQNVATALAGISLQENAERIIEISGQVLKNLAGDEDLSVDDKAELAIAANYQMARAYRALKRPELARSAIRAAVDSALPQQVPSLSFLLQVDGLNLSERHKLLIKAAENIIDRRPSYSISPAMLAFKAADMAAWIGLALELKEDQFFEGLIDVATVSQAEDRFTTLVELAAGSTGSAFNPIAAQLLRRAFRHEPTAAAAAPVVRLNAARSWLLRSKGTERDEAASLFYDLIADPVMDDHITVEDGVLLTNRLGELVRNQEYDEATKIIDLGKRKADFFGARSPLMSALFLIHELNLSRVFFDETNVKRLAREIHALLLPQKLRNDDLAIAYPAIVNQVRDAVRLALEPPALENSLRHFGRNDFVVVKNSATGIESRMKFKRAETGLRTGELELISSSADTLRKR